MKKKYINILFAGLVALGISMTSVSAKSFTKEALLEEVSSKDTGYVYIIGKHAFTDSFQIKTSHILDAAGTFDTTVKPEDKAIYYINTDNGNVIIVGDSEKELDENINITHIDTVPIEDTLGDAIKEAIDTLTEDYNNAKGKYSDTDREDLDEAYKTAIAAMEKAADEAAITAARDAYDTTVAELKTDVQKAEEETKAETEKEDLNNYKKSAIAELEKYKNGLSADKYDKDKLNSTYVEYAEIIDAIVIDENTNLKAAVNEINATVIKAVAAMEAARLKKEDSTITIDTIAATSDLTYMKNNWGYDSALNDQLKSEYVESTKTLTFTGNVAHMPNVKEAAFPNADERTGYYLAYTIHIPEEGNTDNLVITVTSPLGTKTYGKQGNGTLTVLNSINPTDYTTNGKVTITVDYDGIGELYGTTTYYVDYTNVQLGKISELNLDNFDVKSETYLKDLYDWVKPESYLTFTPNKETNTVKVSGTLAPYSEKLTKAGFANDTQYYLGFRIPVNTVGNENMKNSNIVITAKGINTTTIKSADFNNDSDAFVLWMLDPKNTPKENRKITIVVDKDGERNDYSETTYTLDWSDVKFSEVSKLNKISTNIPQTDSTFMRDEWGYEVNNDVTLGQSTGTYKYGATGSVTEQPNVTAFDETESTGYYFAYNLLLNLDTELNGKLTEKDLKDIAITIKNSANGKTKTFGFNDLTIDENGNISLTMLTHINPDSETKEISISVDFDGDKDVFETKNYYIDYSNLTLKAQTSLTVNEVKAGDAVAKELETDYGYKVAEAGRITLNSNIDENGNSTVYAHGFALPVKLSDNVFGEDKDNGYYLPLNIKISHASKISSIIITKASDGNPKTLSDEDLTDVKETGVLNALRLLAANDASKGSSQDKFTIEVKYNTNEKETLADQKITIDTTDVKLGAEGLYEVAYNTTINTEYSIEETTTMIYGSDKITDKPNEFKELFNSKLMSILIPRHIKAVKVDTFNQNGTSKITFSVNGGYFNNQFEGFTGTREDNRPGFFDQALKFTVEIDADNHITSIVSNTLTLGKEISTQNKYIVDTYEYVVKSIDMHFDLSNFTKKTDVKVELAEENTLPDKAETLSSNYYNKHENDTISIGDEYFNFDEVYTEIGKVANINEKEITVNGIKYNSDKFVYISVGKNSMINLPISVIVDDTLYVSTTHLLATNEEFAKVEYDGVTYSIATGIENSESKAITISNVGSWNNSTGKNVVELSKDNSNTINQTTNNSKNGIFVDFKYGEEVLDVFNTSYYRIDDEGNMAIVAPEDNHIYTAYTLPYGKPISKEETIVRNVTLIFPGKGTISFSINVHAIPTE